VYNLKDALKFKRIIANNLLRNIKYTQENFHFEEKHKRYRFFTEYYANKNGTVKIMI